MSPKFKPKILLVDDESEARSALASSLQASGFDVLEATSGKEVLPRAKAEWPALIILDIVLPDMPGTDLFDQLRADPITKAIPVLLITAKPYVVAQLPAFQEKKDRFIEKPARIENMVQVVREMLTGTGH